MLLPHVSVFDDPGRSAIFTLSSRAASIRIDPIAGVVSVSAHAATFVTMTCPLHPSGGSARLHDFDFTFQPSVRRDQIESLHELGFVERRENVIFLGPPGVG